MEEENLKGSEKVKGSSIFKRKEIWISGIVGILIGAILVYLIAIFTESVFGNTMISSKTVVKTKVGKITENDLYSEMRKYYPIEYVLEVVDKQILKEKYEFTEQQEQEINEQVDLILGQYESYGYTEEFFSQNGFEDKEDFVEYMRLDYRRNLYCIDYYKTLISEEEIKNYYNENDIYGEISTKHILVQISDEMTDEQALTMANEIIAKLNSGTNFDEVANEYADRTVSEDVEFDSFNASSLESSYVEASKTLEKSTYTTEAVKTSYGYHIIYCINKEDKPSFEQVENDIVEKLGEDLEDEDQYIRYKALIKLREDNKLDFKDSVFEEEYNEYCKQING